MSVPSAAQRRRTPGIVSHVGVGAESRMLGVTVSAPIQMFVELAIGLEQVDLIALGDALVKRQGMTVARFRELVAARTGRGAADAARAAASVRAEVDSPMETRLRLLLVSAGLPEPVVNHKLRTGSGHVFMRFDLSYPELRLAIEYDGRQHAENRNQWLRDLERREWLDRNGWRVIVVTAGGVFAYPKRTVGRVAEALRERGVPA